MMTVKRLKRTWAEIDLDALHHNVAELRNRLPKGCRFLGVVKADAYGHGAVPIAKELAHLGVEHLAVSNFEEALQMRRADIHLPILILGFTPPEFASEEAALHLTQEVHSLSYAKELSDAAGEKSLCVHIKIDTGMSRLGFFSYDHPETLSELQELYRLPNLHVAGIFTHFAVSDTPAQDDFTQLQHTRFLSVVDALRKQGLDPGLVHCANSGAAIAYPEFSHDMVRPGIAMYGLAPSPELRGAADLHPLMRLCTAIAAIRPFPAGVSVSYGRTYTTPAERTLAVCPIGYADGLPRRLSGGIDFLLHGKRVPIVGRICMDMCMVDITDVPEAQVGDTVTVIGQDGSESISWDDWADQLGTISYELVCGINKRVPRLYFRDGKQTESLQYIV